MQSGVVILFRTDDPVNEDAVRFDGVEDSISLVRPAPDSMLFVARDQREGAGHIT
ncbi:hypothetical protein V473_14185 [Sphingobium cupriresistens LL01]|uniref:Uncharacterized protein n=1 Tax=Sphingobium cupriresistens LL01 TaxID=1420583 RepID=A0A0J7XW63_9SPHN|nr:hypothetical protein V473_14185 [Sphingobium cupriresistens LL01]